MKLNNKSGFTLLEVIIVIIIVGVLSSLALPRFFSTVEFAKSTEALTAINSIRQSIERCGLLNNNNISTCNGFGTLDMDDPAVAQNAHFAAYTIAITDAVGPDYAYTITCRRNATDGGDNTSLITLTVAAAGITRSGTGAYDSL